jgi:alpha-mannosidase
VLLQGRLNESSPRWWEGTDGKKVLLWYSRIYQQMQMLFGLPPLVPAGHDTIPLFLQMYEHPGYHADAAILYGTQVENTDLFFGQAELAQKWNDVYAYPHLQYSGFKDALEISRRSSAKIFPPFAGTAVRIGRTGSSQMRSMPGRSAGLKLARLQLRSWLRSRRW